MKKKILYFLLTIIKISLLLFFIINFSSNQSFDQTNHCDFNKSKYLKELNNKNNIIQINIKTTNLKKWHKNNLKILKNEGRIINQNLKKNFKSIVEINYAFGTCKYKAKIRQTGDFKDHIKFFKGKIFQSLKVKLVNGNVLGNIKFKLLIPQARGQDEVIVANILKSMNILSPEIFQIKVNNNGLKAQMLFHQEADKEFIEQNSMVESAFFEGDDGLIWDEKNLENYNYLQNFSLAKMINTKWMDKNINAKIISSKAYSKIQKIYLNKINKNNTYYFDIFLLSNKNKNFLKKWITFELIMFSTGCTHGLNGINRKFYWDSFHNAFLPIFYDGDCKIDYKYNLRLIKHDFLTTADKFYYRKIFTSKNIDEIKSKLLNLNIDSIRKNLNGNNKLSKIKIKNKINIIVKNLNELKKYIHAQDKNYNSDDEYINNFDISEINKIFKKKLSNYFFLDLDIKNILPFDKSKFFKCKNDICNYQNLEIKKIFSMSKKQKDAKYFFNNFIDKENNIINENFFVNDNKIKIRRTIGITFTVENNNIFIKQNSPDDWIVFFNSDLQNINIDFSGFKLQDKKYLKRFNDNGLTGCLNFFNINFKKMININHQNSNCEDSINIRNSRGEIQNIKIQNSIEDSLDIDFSNILLKNVYINKAQNDCIDLSFGVYKIKNSKMSNCADKSISLGERSILEIQNAKISNSDKAFVSKDSSILNVKKFELQNVNYCASAYNKKQEFDGAIIYLNKNKCKDGKLHNDNISKIIF